MTTKLWGIRLQYRNNAPAIVEAHASHSHAVSRAALMRLVPDQTAIVVPCEVTDLGVPL